MNDWYYGYECLPPCQLPTGVTLDLRLPPPVRDEAPEVHCPICQKSMTYKGCWPADEAGYGYKIVKTGLAENSAEE